MEEKLSSSLFLPGRGFFDNHVTVSRVPVRKLSSKFDVMKSLPEALEFINKVYWQNEILFLPDLASAHNTLPTQALFDELYIPYVPLEAKPHKSPQPPLSGGFLGNPEREEYLDKLKCLEAKCGEKTLEKSGLEPTAPNRLADRKHCALSTQPSPDFSRFFSRHLASGHLNLSGYSSHVQLCRTQANSSNFNPERVGLQGMLGSSN